MTRLNQIEFYPVQDWLLISHKDLFIHQYENPNSDYYYFEGIAKGFGEIAKGVYHYYVYMTIRMNPTNNEGEEVEEPNVMLATPSYVKIKPDALVFFRAKKLRNRKFQKSLLKGNGFAIHVDLNSPFLITCVNVFPLLAYGYLNYYPTRFFRPRMSCWHCEANLTEEEFKKCGKCKFVGYCNRNCQLKHWKTSHKSICDYLSRLVDFSDKYPKYDRLNGIKYLHENAMKLVNLCIERKFRFPSIQFEKDYAKTYHQFINDNIPPNSIQRYYPHDLLNFDL